MTVELECEPMSPGHVRLRLVVGMASVELDACFFSEPVDDLVGAIEALLRGHPGPRVILADPPLEYRCLLDPEPGKRVRLRLLRFPGWPSGMRDEEGQGLLDATCQVAALANAAAACVAKLESTYGAEGFEDRTKMQLPVKRRPRIEALLKHEGA